MPELQKLLHSMKMSIENSVNPPKTLIPNTGLNCVLCHVIDIILHLLLNV